MYVGKMSIHTTFKVLNMRSHDSYDFKPSRILNSVQSGASGERLGWVELDLGCSTILLGQLVATEAAYKPGELPTSKSTQPSRKPDAPDCSREQTDIIRSRPNQSLP